MKYVLSIGIMINIFFMIYGTKEGWFMNALIASVIVGLFLPVLINEFKKK